MQWVQTHIVDWDADHYFEAGRLSGSRICRIRLMRWPKRSNALRSSNPGAEDQPLVVVTATGGGIQAAEWTAQVMARLEKEFREDKQNAQRLSVA